VTFVANVGAAVPALAGAFIAAAIVAVLLTPGVRFVARHLDVVDLPEERRVNTRPMPRGGGLAVVAAFVLIALAALAWNEATRTFVVPSSLDPGTVIALLAGGVAAAMIGAIDDYLQIRARWQLAGQLLLALWAVALGVTADVLSTPFSDHPISIAGPIAAGFTVFWIVGMINAINFIDGLDGLSSGIGLIAAVTLGLVSLTTTVSQPLVAVLCFALAGALLGFLRWNFHPASIITGTSGVMFLGYTLALLSILGTAKVPIALLVLGVPIIDTFWVIVRRLATGRMPFSPDRGHIHHRLLDLGLSHRQAVLAIYLICIVLATIGLILPGRSQVYAFVGLVVVSAVVVAVLARRTMSTSGLSAESYTQHDDVDRESMPPSEGSLRDASASERTRPEATARIPAVVGAPTRAAGRDSAAGPPIEEAREA
jgi:UDP-GlcNAc:undecaprenyl-phosphate GlcNAc-1-phosphate transferase